MTSGRIKVAILVAWALLLAGWAAYLRTTGQDPASWLQGGVDQAKGAWWAIPAYIAAWLVRPLLLFPAILLTVAGGILFGAVVGLPLTLAAATASAVVAYAIARRLGPATFGDGVEVGLLHRWAARLRRQGFLTVVLMRLALLPFDFVSFAAGVMRVDVRAFALATALGSIPATAALVLAGASLDRLDVGLDGLDTNVFAASLAIFVVSLVISRVVQRRTAPAA